MRPAGCAADLERLMRFEIAPAQWRSAIIRTF
jgi:hypothetical protein